MIIGNYSAADFSVFVRVCVEPADFDRLNRTDKAEIEDALNSAIAYVGSYTGLDMSGEVPEEIGYAVRAVAAEMYDNRQVTEQYSLQNKTVMQILDMHSTNLIPSFAG